MATPNQPMPNDDKLHVAAVEIAGPFDKLIAKGIFNANTFPHVAEMLDELANEYAAQWRSYTQGEAIPPSGRKINSRGDYTRSIGVDTTSPFVKLIFSAASKPYTEWIERGHEEYDMKPFLLAGPKARQGKSGPYNIIPFRHGVPGTNVSNHPMPKSTYSIMQKMTNRLDNAFRAGQSAIPGTSRVLSVTQGPAGIRRTYQWGYRLPESQGGPRQTKVTQQHGMYTWATGEHSSMYRMEASTKNARSSTYMTFRIVSIHSNPSSWIMPEVPAVAIREAVVKKLAPITREAMAEAMKKDLE